MMHMRVTRQISFLNDCSNPKCQFQAFEKKCNLEESVPKALFLFNKKVLSIDFEGH